MSDYYIIHPNGREKLRATTDWEATVEFSEHWSSKADWLKGKKPLVRRLMKTTTIEILSEPIKEERLR